MVDYVSSFIKKLKKHKAIAGIIIAVTAIMLIANFLGALSSIYEYFSPTTNLNIRLYNWGVVPTYSDDNSTFVGLNATFPVQITNVGKEPIHIVACDVFLQENGKPVGLHDEPYSEIAYLKPDESFSYNVTKCFNVSIPVKTAMLSDLTNYLILVVYTDSHSLEAKSVWKDPSKF